MRRMKVPIDKRAKHIKITDEDFTKADNYLSLYFEEGFYEIDINESLESDLYLEIVANASVLAWEPGFFDNIGITGVVRDSTESVRLEEQPPYITIVLPSNGEVTYSTFYLLVSNGLAYLCTNQEI